MSTLRLLLFVAAAAAPVAPNGCAAPQARIDVERLEATRPNEQVLLHCRVSGFSAAPRLAWQLGAGVRTIGSAEPLDEEALLVQISDSNKAAQEVTCTATGEGVVIARAAAALGPSLVSTAKLSEGHITVEGSALLALRGEADGVWLVPGRGAAVPADHSCKEALWSDTKVVACLPKLARQPYQVRVQSGGRLALGPLVIP